MYDIGSNGSNGSNGSRPEPPDRSGSVAIHWENLMSLRYWFGSLFGSIVFVVAVAIAVGLFGISLSDAAIQALFFGFLVLSLIGGLVGRRYWCPYCRGMVKAGATVCRHCGREFEV